MDQSITQWVNGFAGSNAILDRIMRPDQFRGLRRRGMLVFERLPASLGFMTIPVLQRGKMPLAPVIAVRVV